MNITFIYNNLNEGVFGSYKNMTKDNKIGDVKRDTTKIYKNTILEEIKKESIVIISEMLEKTSNLHNDELVLKDYLHLTKTYIYKDSTGDKLIIASPVTGPEDFDSPRLNLSPTGQHMFSFRQSIEKALQEYFYGKESYQRLGVYKLEFKFYLHLKDFGLPDGRMLETIDIDGRYRLEDWKEFIDSFVPETKLSTVELAINEVDMGKDYADLGELLKVIDFETAYIYLYEPMTTLASLLKTVPPNKEISLTVNRFYENYRMKSKGKFIKDKLVKEITGYQNSAKLFQSIIKPGDANYTSNEYEYLSKCKDVVLHGLTFTTTTTPGIVTNIKIAPAVSLSK